MISDIMTIVSFIELVLLKLSTTLASKSLLRRVSRKNQLFISPLFLDYLFN